MQGLESCIDGRWFCCDSIKGFLTAQEILGCLFFFLSLVLLGFAMKDVILFIHSYKTGIGLINRVIERVSFYTEDDVSNYTERNDKITEDVRKEVQEKIIKDFPEIEGNISLSIVRIDPPVEGPGEYLLTCFVRQLSENHPKILEHVEVVGRLDRDQNKPLSPNDFPQETQDKIKQIIDDYFNTYPYPDILDKVKMKIETLVIE